MAQRTVSAIQLQAREGGWWRVRQRVLSRWIRAGTPTAQGGWAVKTDLFDEASGPHHHFGDLSDNHRLIGMDWDLGVARAAKTQIEREGPTADLIVCDVRALPFAAASLLAVLSLSTLDHFQAVSSIEHSLVEIARVLVVDGRLILTLDNPWNPEVFLRARLPSGLVQLLRADKFRLGKTINRRQAERIFSILNLEITAMKFLIHGPRFIAIRSIDWLENLGAQRIANGVAGVLEWLERLSMTPLRAVTGHYAGWWLKRAAGE